jgi:hypothetical protein
MQEIINTINIVELASECINVALNYLYKTKLNFNVSIKHLRGIAW